MRRTFKSGCLAAAILLAGLGAPTVASGESGGDSTTERAEEHADEGARLYAQGEYGRALVQFQKAHLLEPEPTLLFNITLSYSKLGRCDKVLDKGKELENKYSLNEKMSTTNRALMVGCRRVNKTRDIVGEFESTADDPDFGVDEEVGLDESSEPTAEETDGDESTEEEASGKEEEAAAEDSDDETAKDETRAEASSEETAPSSSGGGGGFGPLGWIGATSAGLGAVGGVATLVIRSQLTDDWRAYERAAATGDTEAYEQYRESIPQKQTVGKVVGFTSLGLSTVGLALITAELVGGNRADASASTPRIGVRIGRDRTLVDVELQFAGVGGR